MPPPCVLQAKGTCPGLTNFRVARVRGWQRVFAHPAAIFFERGIALPATKEIASLSAELGGPDSSFVVATFEVNNSLPTRTINHPPRCVHAPLGC
jgi:hypothetical protein